MLCTVIKLRGMLEKYLLWKNIATLSNMISIYPKHPVMEGPCTNTALILLTLHPIWMKKSPEMKADAAL